jgi:uncharacterized protein with HEPN domain
MKGLLSDKIRLRHILDAIAEVEKYLEDVTYEDYLASSEKRFATIKQIEIIGEACHAISDEVKQANSSIQWRPIVAFRNISIHEYFGVNFQIVWEIAKNDLPILKEKVIVVIESL